MTQSKISKKRWIVEATTNPCQQKLERYLRRVLVKIYTAAEGVSETQDKLKQNITLAWC